MKNRIVDVSEPKDEVELHRVRNAKRFNNVSIEVVASATAAMIGNTVGFTFFQNEDIIGGFLGSFMYMVCACIITPKLLSELQILYDKKGNENVVGNDLNGSKSR